MRCAFDQATWPAPGAWTIAPDRALRLRPREDAWLRACHGRLWVTLGIGLTGAERDGGDHLLMPGERMAVKAGQRVVVGAGGSRHDSAAFDWEPVRGRVLVRSARPGWRDELVHSLQRWGAGLAAAA